MRDHGRSGMSKPELGRDWAVMDPLGVPARRGGSVLMVLGAVSGWIRVLDSPQGPSCLPGGTEMLIKRTPRPAA